MGVPGATDSFGGALAPAPFWAATDLICWNERHIYRILSGTDFTDYTPLDYVRFLYCIAIGHSLFIHLFSAVW